MSYEIKTKELPKSEVEIEVSLPSDFLVLARKKAVGLFGDSLDIAGFRKGHVPENIIVEKIGEGKILEEAVDILLKEHFPKIIEQARLPGRQEKLDIIGRPKISVTKLALNNPVEFKAAFAVTPVFEIPDYRRISKEMRDKNNETREEVEASEKEVTDVLFQIRKNKAHYDWHQKNPNEKGHNHPEIKDEDLPELNDEFAKQAGNFKNLDELKEKVKENIIAEKKIRNIEKRRAEIMEEFLKNTKIELPEILIESEIEKALAQMKDDVARMGAKFEDYLTNVKKQEEDLRKDLRENSEKKAKIQLIFNKIAETEKLEPNKEILEQEIKHILEHYKDASDLSREASAKWEANARIYVSTLLLNQEVLKLLEKE